MLLNVGPVWAEVATASPEDVAWLTEFLSFDDPEAKRQQEMLRWRLGDKAPTYDTRLHLYQPGRRRFPAGLLRAVSTAAARAGRAVEVVSTVVVARPEPVELPFLRDYQRAALDAALGGDRGVVKAPTGAGKTVVMAGLLASVPGRWLVAAPQVDLLRQTAARVKEFTGEECGLVGDGEWDVDRRVTVATLQTLADRLGTEGGRRLLTGLAGVVVDECHVLGAPGFYKVLMACTAPRRVGFSATPFSRGDGRSVYVMAALGPKLYEVQATALVEAGVLSRPTITMFPLRQSLPHNLSWTEVYRRGVVESEARNAAVVALARESEKPCLVFVKDIQHGRVLLRAFRRAGVRAGFVWGDTDSAGRAAAVKSLVQGDYEVLVSSTIFEQGVDIKEVRSVVVASGGKSAIRAVQRLGRGMRVAEGKKAMQLWDFDDSGQVWLDRHSGQRMAAYVKEGHQVLRMDRGTAQLLLAKYAQAA